MITMEILHIHLEEQSLWKRIRQENPDNRPLVRDLYKAGQAGDQKLFAANLMILLSEAERLGFHRGLLRSR
jgi:hypothetical protein